MIEWLPDDKIRVAFILLLFLGGFTLFDLFAQFIIKKFVKERGKK